MDAVCRNNLYPINLDKQPWKKMDLRVSFGFVKFSLKMSFTIHDSCASLILKCFVFLDFMCFLSFLWSLVNFMDGFGISLQLSLFAV